MEPGDKQPPDSQSEPLQLRFATLSHPITAHGATDGYTVLTNQRPSHHGDITVANPFRDWSGGRWYLNYFSSSPEELKQGNASVKLDKN
ncbi:hypothetical protein chiPu_0013153 [Chiloscyllium punctatum]|uniref:Uncharacterized protein n=1 Tax=Chiloscyllium punctatum TaxID=137246 RepID=A0A401SWC0_CHIPU|nr:hypothetical protein [Chiloscyllium punctatum]